MMSSDCLFLNWKVKDQGHKVTHLVSTNRVTSKEVKDGSMIDFKTYRRVDLRLIDVKNFRCIGNVIHRVFQDQYNTVQYKQTTNANE